MKTLQSIIFFLFMVQIGFAQVPKTFNYQAVARDENGVALANQNIVVEISVRKGNTSGTIEWQEVHYTQTNAFGLFTVEIGGSTAIRTEEGTASSFDQIDWSIDTYYIQTRVDFGKSEFINGFIDMGTVKLSSVPYAFVSDSTLHAPVPNLTDVLGINQSSLSTNDVPKWNGTNWTVGSAGVSGNYITDDGTTDLTGDWTITSNSINLTSGSITLSNGNLTLSNGILSSSAISIDATTFTSVSTDLNVNSASTALATANAVKTYVDNNAGISYWTLNSGRVYNSTNYIGIGTSSPEERLHVNLIGNETVLYTGAYSAAGNITNRGAGTRFEFSPARGSLRAGTINGTQWDDSNVGKYSVAFGENNSASGDYSFSSGMSNTSSGSFSTAIGSTNSASGSKSVALGQSNTAQGASSVAINELNTASGPYSTSMGLSTTAEGDYSLSLGTNSHTYPGANGSVAAGSGTQAYGLYSVALGESSQTSTGSQSSFAGGNSSVTGGKYSFSFGDNTASYGYSEFAIGRYNTIIAQTYDGWVLSDRVFVVGIGVGPASRANAMVILKNGNIGIGVDNPSVALAVAGDITATGAITATSDARYKKNVVPISSPVSKLMQLQGVYYNWKVDEYPEKKFSEKKQMGLIAQEVEKVVPEVVATDAKGFKSIDYAKLNALLIETIKVQQNEINRLKKNQEMLMRDLKK